MLNSIQQFFSALSLHANRYREKCQKSIKPYFAFTKATLSDPRAIGAACPSSPFLAKEMARQVDANNNGYVIELGGGTGMITRALLAHGVSPERLITVEYSHELAEYLRQEFPNIHVLEGNAERLDQLLEESLIDNKINNIHAIVSGLPLRSLPKNSVKAIKQQIYQLIGDDGLFVQFTYSLRLSGSYKEKFTLQNTQVVMRNIPPARVNTYVKE